MQKTTNQLNSPSNNGVCPFCAEQGVQWNNKDCCVSCGQPRIVAPSGAYALCVKEVSLFARPCLSLYTLSNHRVELDIHNEEDASTLNATLSGALLGCQLNRLTNSPQFRGIRDADE